MKRFSVALFLVMSLATAPALACSCVVTGSERTHIREQFESSDAVFSGYIHEIHYGSMFGRDNVRMAKVRVLQVWKGALVPSSWVTVAADEDTGFVGCGYPAAEDSAILVYATGTEPFVLHSCSRTGPLNSRTADIPLLNKLSAKPEFKLGR